MRTWITGLLLLVVVTSCGTPPPRASEPATTSAPTTPTTVAPTAATITDGLREARERWETADLSTYHYLFVDDCDECDESAPRQVVVWDDELITPGVTGPPIEDAFSMVEKAAAEDRPVDVTFHPDLGFPIEIWVDREARPGEGATHWIFSDLTAGLPGAPAAIESHREAGERWAAAGVSSYEYRMLISCDCGLESSAWTRVEEGLVTDWLADPTPEGGALVIPTTIDQLLDDIGELIGADDGSVEAGFRTTGSALYDEGLGVPKWIGLDIEVLDPDSAAAFLPARLVLVVTEFTEIATDDRSEIDGAMTKWAEKGLRDYSYLLTFHDIQQASFSDPLEVVVSDGVVTSTSLEGEPTKIEGPTPAPIEMYFDLIEGWMDAGSQVDVIYHSSLGHPIFVAAIHPDGSTTTFSIAELTPG